MNIIFTKSFHRGRTSAFVHHVGSSKVNHTNHVKRDHLLSNLSALHVNVPSCGRQDNVPRKNEHVMQSWRRHSTFPKASILGGAPFSRLEPCDVLQSSRFMSSKRCLSSLTANMTSCAASSPEAEMAKFEMTAASAEAVVSATDASMPWQPTWWPQDQILDLIIQLHDASGLNYALTIGALTLAFRTVMLPLFIKAQQNSSRLAHLKPEMDVLQEKMKLLNPNDLEGQQKIAKQVQALFQKYDCNPLKSLMILPIQMPVFMGTFFALKQFPDIFPEKLVDSGILWFTDLSVPDPYGILPISSALSFLAMMEMGKKQMMATNPAQGKAMLNFFRGVAVIMIPATWNFPAVIFCYWTANNVFSMVQSAAFNSASIRKTLGIWDPPKPVPGAPPPKGMKELFDDMMKKRREESQKSSIEDRIKMRNAAIDKKNADRISDDSIAGRKRRKGRGSL